MTLQIKDWDEHFESAASRKLRKFTFAPVPIRQGSFYVEMMAEDNGLELYACWCQILSIASTCKHRGVLVRGNGKPHTSRTLGMIARMDIAAMDRALGYLLSVGRVEVSNIPQNIPRSSGGNIPTEWDIAAGTFPDKEGRKEGKKEGRNKGDDSPEEESPPNATRSSEEAGIKGPLKGHPKATDEVRPKDVPSTTINDHLGQPDASSCQIVPVRTNSATLPALSPDDIIGVWEAVTGKSVDPADVSAAGTLATQQSDISRIRRAMQAFNGDPKASRFPLKTFAKQFAEWDRPPKTLGMEAAERDADNHQAAVKEAQDNSSPAPAGIWEAISGGSK